jgi:hypothetical protein
MCFYPEARLKTRWMIDGKFTANCVNLGNIVGTWLIGFRGCGGCGGCGYGCGGGCCIWIGPVQKMNGGLGIPHHSQKKIGIRIWARLRIVGGDTTPICVERVLCPVATCKFWVYERQCCGGEGAAGGLGGVKSRG